MDLGDVMNARSGAGGTPGPKKKDTPYADQLKGGTSKFPVVLPSTPFQTPIGPPTPKTPIPGADVVDAVTMAAPSTQQLIKQGVLPPSVVSTPPGTSPGTAGTPAPPPSGGGTKPAPDPFAAPPSSTSAGNVSSVGVIQRGTQDAVASLDGALSEIRGIMGQSSTDPKMMSIVYKFINGLSEALASIQDELAGWYAKMGGEQDLGLQNAIQVLREEIDFQKAQLAEGLNARGMLESGIMASAEAMLRRGGLDQVQQMVANRLSELQGVILQSVSSLAQTRMQGLSNIYQQGLQSVTSMANAREATRGQAISTFGNLMNSRAQALQGGAMEESAAMRGEAQAQYQRWLDQQTLNMQAEQNAAQRNLWSAQAAAYNAEARAGAGYTSVDAGSLLSNAISKINAGVFTQQDYDTVLTGLRQEDPDMAPHFEFIIQQYLRGKALPGAPQGQTATGWASGGSVKPYWPVLPNPNAYNKE